MKRKSTAAGLPEVIASMDDDLFELEMAIFALKGIVFHNMDDSAHPGGRTLPWCPVEIVLMKMEAEFGKLKEKYVRAENLASAAASGSVA